MYINRALLLVAGLVIVFYPAVDGWLFGSGATWYRPYQVWLLVIVAAWWNQRSRFPDEL
jgi:hypothetical protein